MTVVRDDITRLKLAAEKIRQAGWGVIRVEALLPPMDTDDEMLEVLYVGPSGPMRAEFRPDEEAPRVLHGW